MNTLDALDADSLRDDIPDFRPGDTVKVHVRVVEGNRSRIQVFQGVVIRRQGGGIRETFTVRKVSFGVGVERTFPVHTPVVEKIEVVTRGDVRRAKLYYLRELRGKAAKIKEKREHRRALTRSTAGRGPVVAAAGLPRRTLLVMSSDRPGGPADVVPGGRPRATGAAATPRTRAGRRGTPVARRRGRGEAEEGLAAARAAGAAADRASCWPWWSRPSSSRPSSSRRARWSRRCTAAPGCTGDRVLVNKVPYWFGEPEPGDIVVFKGPDTWAPEVVGRRAEQLVLRCAAVARPRRRRGAAQRGRLRQAGHRHRRADRAVLRRPGAGDRRRQAARRALHLREHPASSRGAFGPVTVPEGRLWVMGDHRSASADSARAHQ